MLLARATCETPFLCALSILHSCSPSKPVETLCPVCASRPRLQKALILPFSVDDGAGYLSPCPNASTPSRSAPPLSAPPRRRTSVALSRIDPTFDPKVKPADGAQCPYPPPTRCSLDALVGARPNWLVARGVAGGVEIAGGGTAGAKAEDAALGGAGPWLVLWS